MLHIRSSPHMIFFYKPQIYESFDIKSRKEDRREEKIEEDRRR
jgi:hypothetical protein